MSDDRKRPVERPSDKQSETPTIRINEDRREPVTKMQRPEPWPEPNPPTPNDKEGK
jgi:hypothetical protein